MYDLEGNMEFWFSELHSPHVKFDIRVEKQLFSGKAIIRG